jgi:ABC-type multidrug transport system ATPase subunit
MITIENISFQNGEHTLFNNLNNSFEPSQIHGVWHTTASGNTAFLQMLAGSIPLCSGIIAYEGMELDYTSVAYYNLKNMPWLGFQDDNAEHHRNKKLIYLFDNLFSIPDFRSIIHLYKAIHSLKKAGRTIIITSTDYKELVASTDYFHLMSNNSFPLKLHYKNYDLLDNIFRQMV